MVIKKKLFFTFLAISLIPMALVGGIVFYKAQISLRRDVVERLHAITELQEGKIFLYLNKLKTRTNDFASDGFIQQQMEKIAAGDQEREALGRALTTYLIKNKKPLDDRLLAIDLLDPKGTVIASTEPGRIGIDQAHTSCFLMGQDQGYISEIHDHETHKSGIDASSPIRGFSGEQGIAGVLVNSFDFSAFHEMFIGDMVLKLGAKTQLRGVGRTGKIYLVNKDHDVVTEYLFMGKAPFAQSVNTYPVKKCFEEGREVSGSWQDYRGVDVIGASMCIATDGFQVTLLSEQDATEALAPVTGLMKLSLILVLGSMFFIGVAVLQIAHFIADPIKKLQRSTQIIGSGDLDHKVEGIKSRDEIGQLARAFDQMTGSLKEVLTSRDELNKEIAVRKQSEERFRRFVDTAPDAIVIVGEDGTIELVNKRTEAMFGYTREELIGKTVEYLMPASYRERHVQHRKQYSMRPEVRLMALRDRDLVAQRKDGSRFYVEINLSPLVTQHGTLVSAAIRDISDRKRTELLIIQKNEELKRSNQELEQFAYIASHDLQEPLRKVKTFGDRLIQKYSETIGEQGQEYLARMKNATSRMQTLIDDLLTYSRVTSKAQPFIRVDLNDIVRGVLSDLEVKIEEVQAQIKIDNLPSIEADPVQMRQLFQNLIGNALKFHKPDEPPVIEICSVLKPLRDGNAENQTLVHNCERHIKITDNGIGFDEQYKERIFNVFQRLHGRSEYEGTGIGLAVCRKIVTRHRGSIDVESAPGRGSTFTVILPVVQPKTETKGDV